MHIKRFEFNPFSENTYILFDESKEAAVIDCGALDAEEWTQLNDFVQENNLIVKFVLNTHLHLDHAFGLFYLYKIYNIKPQYHRNEVEMLPNLNRQAEAFGISFPEESVPVENFLEEGDKVKFGNVTLEVIFVPGHSPGSLCFYSKKDNCIFTGDVIFRGSIGRTDLWGGDYSLLIHGIKEKLLTLPEETAIYPGHGPVTTVRYEKNSNPFLRV